MRRTFTRSEPTPSSRQAIGCVFAVFLLASAMAQARYDTPAYVQFHPTAHYAVSADQSHAVVTVFRGGDFQVPAAVDFQTQDGSALANVDYQATGGRLIFSPGESEQTFSIPLLPNTSGGDRTLTVILSNPGPNVEILLATATLTINGATEPSATELPRLNIQAGGGTIVLSWPMEFPNLVLEKSTDLAGPVWLPVNSPASLVQGEFTVYEELSETNYFYRLRFQANGE